MNQYPKWFIKKSELKQEKLEKLYYSRLESNKSIERKILEIGNSMLDDLEKEDFESAQKKMEIMEKLREQIRENIKKNEESFREERMLASIITKKV